MSNKELDLEPSQLMITKTDLSGKLTYCNQSFIKVSGYTEQQLINQSFEQFCHSDMPSGVFHLMWQTLKQKREFNGYFKFNTAAGDSYWAFVNITPFYGTTSVVAGYTCAMRQPNPAATMMFSMYYEQMCDLEGGSKNESSAKASLQLLIELLSATGDDYEASVFKLQFS